MATSGRDKLVEILSRRQGHTVTNLPSNNRALVDVLFDARDHDAASTSATAFDELRAFFNVDADFQEKSALFCVQYKNEGLQKLKRECHQEAAELFSKALRHCSPYDGTAVTSSSASSIAATHDDVIALQMPEVSEKPAELFHYRAKCALADANYALCLKDVKNALMFSGRDLKRRQQLLKCFVDCNTRLERSSESRERLDAELAALELSDDDTKETLKFKEWLKLQLTSLEANTVDKHNDDAMSGRDVTNPLAIARDVPLNHCSTSGQLQVAQSPDFGHYLTAREDIAVGETVMTNAPLASVLFEDCHKNSCYWCMRHIESSFPCRHCSAVSYCDHECEARSWREAHRFECSYQEWLSEEWCLKLGHLTLRLAMKTFASAVCTHFYPPSTSQHDVGFEYDAPDDVTYRDLLLLVSHETARSYDSNMQAMLSMCVLLYEILRNSGFIREALNDACAKNGSVAISEDSVDFRRFIIAHLLKMMQIIQCNGFTVTKMRNSTDMTRSKPKDIGLALYVYASLFNHSCDADVDIVYHGHVMLVYAMKDIARGQQVFCDYGFAFYLDERAHRRSTLKMQYFFDCICRACAEHWPLWQEIECKQPSFKCRSCAHTLDLAKARNFSAVKCAGCATKHDIQSLLAELSKSHERYRVSMQLALSGSRDVALPGFLAHLSLTQRALQQPWREFYSCQAAVVQCFRLRGNVDDVIF